MSDNLQLTWIDAFVVQIVRQSRDEPRLDFYTEFLKCLCQYITYLASAESAHEEVTVKYPVQRGAQFQHMMEEIVTDYESEANIQSVV